MKHREIGTAVGRGQLVEAFCGEILLQSLDFKMLPYVPQRRVGKPSLVLYVPGNHNVYAARPKAVELRDV